MSTGVVPSNHHLEMKKKALKAALLEEYKERLEKADPKQRKKIMKDIADKVDTALKSIRREIGISDFLIR